MRVVTVEGALGGIHLHDKTAFRMAESRLNRSMLLVNSASKGFCSLNIPTPPFIHNTVSAHQPPTSDDSIIATALSHSQLRQHLLRLQLRVRNLNVCSAEGAVRSFQLMLEALPTTLSVEDRRVYVVAPQSSSTLRRIANCVCISSSCDFKSAISPSRLRSALFAASNSRSRRCIRS